MALRHLLLICMVAAAAAQSLPVSDYHHSASKTVCWQDKQWANCGIVGLLGGYTGTSEFECSAGCHGDGGYSQYSAPFTTEHKTGYCNWVLSPHINLLALLVPRSGNSLVGYPVTSDVSSAGQVTGTCYLKDDCGDLGCKDTVITVQGSMYLTPAIGNHNVTDVTFAADFPTRGPTLKTCCLIIQDTLVDVFGYDFNVNNDNQCLLSNKREGDKVEADSPQGHLSQLFDDFKAAIKANAGEQRTNGKLKRGVVHARKSSGAEAHTASANYESRYHAEPATPVQWYEGLALVISGATTITSVTGGGQTVEETGWLEYTPFLLDWALWGPEKPTGKHYIHAKQGQYKLRFDVEEEKPSYYKGEEEYEPKYKEEKPYYKEEKPEYKEKPYYKEEQKGKYEPKYKDEYKPKYGKDKYAYKEHDQANYVDGKEAKAPRGE